MKIFGRILQFVIWLHNTLKKTGEIRRREKQLSLSLCRVIYIYFFFNEAVDELLVHTMLRLDLSHSKEIYSLTDKNVYTPILFINVRICRKQLRNFLSYKFYCLFNKSGVSSQRHLMLFLFFQFSSHSCVLPLYLHIF
jgi:hypothetical protein